MTLGRLLAAVMVGSWPVLSGCSAPTGNEAAVNRAANSSTAADAQHPPPTATEIYALRERCGQDAQAAFALMKQLGGPAPGQISDSYSNHYDAITNQCFMLTTTIWKTQDSSGGDRISTDEILYNANDKTEMGEFVQSVLANDLNSKIITSCWVTNDRCGTRSEAAFRALLAPYMGDLSYAPGAW
jgi:hypothetical protein